MQWEQSLYRVTLRSNPDTILTQTNIRMKDEELAGFLWMADLLLGTARSAYLTVDIFTTRRPVAYVQSGRLLGQVWDYVPMQPEMFQIYVLADLPFLLDPENATWNDYILTLERYQGQTFNEPIMPYHARFINRNANRMLIVQFINQQFIRGALRLLSWLNLNPNNYIDLMGVGDDLRTFNQIE